MSQYFVTPPAQAGGTDGQSVPPPGPPAEPVADLLRQLLEVQKEQLAFQRAAHDTGARWRAFLARWQEDFPELPGACKHALPVLERAYGALLAELADHLRHNGDDALDNEFHLGEFLDRYGMRLGQLGGILSLVAYLAEAANPAGEKKVGE
jgi:hypothetical protein